MPSVLPSDKTEGRNLLNKLQGGRDESVDMSGVDEPSLYLCEWFCNILRSNVSSDMRTFFIPQGVRHGLRRAVPIPPAAYSDQSMFCMEFGQVSGAISCLSSLYMYIARSPGFLHHVHAEIGGSKERLLP